MSGSTKLTNLDPKFIVQHGAVVGVTFFCPACPKNAAGGAHRIRVKWEAILEPGQSLEEPIWNVTDRESFEHMSISPSIDGTGGGACKFHGWVTNGLVTW